MVKIGLFIIILFLFGCGSIGEFHNPYKQDAINLIAPDGFDFHVTENRKFNRSGFFTGFSWDLK